MDKLFSHLALADVHCNIVRNIVSNISSQNLFDDLTDNPEDWELAQQVEEEVKPPSYQSRSPIIHRPFEDAEWFNAIGFPFKNWQASRFSDGAVGVWYGCHSIETSVFETAYHWFNGLLSDAGFEKNNVIGKRELYDVACDAALLDLRPQLAKYSGLMHKTDYSYTQSIGSRLHREGHPGLVTASVRHAEGRNYVIFNPDVLSNPRFNCQLTYRLEGNDIFIEKQPGVAWMKIEQSFRASPDYSS
jgi:hypothetical protein